GIDSGRFRDLDNQDIVVDITATAALAVVCVAPLPPTLDPEPDFTPGATNTLTWSDESDVGAVEYNVKMSTDADFSVILDESGWITGLSHEFTGLTDGQEYFFKVIDRNFTGKVSKDSDTESTMQDGAPPTTSAQPLDPTQYLVDFQISFLADDIGSGFDQLDLIYRHDGGLWTNFGSFVTSPIEFTATDGDGLYEFFTMGTDIAGNAETTPAGPQASTTLDTSEPYGSFVINADAEATNTANVVLIVSVIRADEMRFSNDGIDWSTGWVSVSGVHVWTIPATEGIHTVYGEFRDGAMQVLQANDDIEFDITPTGGVTSPSAAPGHESVLLSWTNPTDPDFHSVEVWRGLYHDGAHESTYPSYIGSTIPTPPADRAAALASPEWELAGRSEFGATSFIDSWPTRGVYYYEFFATDPANNYSVPAGDLPRATNYILGDIAQPFDGLVKVEDVTILGAVYNVSVFNPLYFGEADVGPTDDTTGTGIPQPDDNINYDDYLIFAMTYMPSAKSLEGAGSSSATSRTVILDWRPDGDRTWTLDLVAPCPILKGVGLSAALPQNAVPLVTAGQAVISQVDPFFLMNIDQHGLEAGLVILGTGRGMTTTGSLLTVELPAGMDPGLLDIGNITLDLRDVNNKPLEYDLQGKSGAVPPATFSLGEAYPNPFNPSTTIGFSIPGEMPVRLEIYGMDGRRVAVLVDETLGSGSHEAVWLGRDDTGRQVASGVYFSKLLAGSQSQVRKMTLMK
ncbi:MAG: T9SS type A sorting domain-containing protein, partial [Candidatus Krumholzibacteria bacterium]|nr:T9SS type A sorting domain-containing protein [Candidatus Krumholzibacteria bacterium]